MENNEQKLGNIRHTLAHLLAQAVTSYYPDVKLTLGPAIDNGFYYDMDLGEQKITDAEIPKLTEKMRELLPTWTEFTHEIVTAEHARGVFAGNQYKLELIDEIVGRGEDITLYTCGGFTDLCRGGHCDHPYADIDPESFQIDRIAGAYWRGDENNKMLTRVYGLAFMNKADLDNELWVREEAKKRDHKKLGAELDLFVFSPLVGGGLPLWTPAGTLLRNTLDEYVWELRKKYGYEKVEIPHITKKELYETSGHWDKYKDDLFRIVTREGHEFAMKPMNCPHHTQIFDRKQWSYRELPQRYANTTACYRDEQSGELSGLQRVRGFCQDDAHVFCRLSDFQAEAENIWDIVREFYGRFGMNIRVRLSTHDPEKAENYLGNPDSWKFAEETLSKIAEKKGSDMEVFPGVGEAAFYGPKIDFMARDSMGRETQVATIQLDMVMPERFDLFCINETGAKERIVMIHAAIMGSIERFTSVLIEHLSGNFPVWLAPTQVAILPVSAEHHGAYADELYAQLKQLDIRASLASDESLGKRIRNAKNMRIPYQVVIGDAERDSGTVTVEGRNGYKEVMSREDFITKLQTEIRQRTLN